MSIYDRESRKESLGGNFEGDDFNVVNINDGFKTIYDVRFIDKVINHIDESFIKFL